MANKIHISQARKLLQSGKPIDLFVLTKTGLQYWRNCVSLKYDFYSGTRNVKLLESGEIRKVRDSLIFEINNTQIYV